VFSVVSVLGACSSSAPNKRDTRPADPEDAAMMPPTPRPEAGMDTTRPPVDMAMAPPDGGAPDVAVERPVPKDAPPLPPNEWRISSSADDAEEYVTDTATMGTDLTSSDLEITRDITAGRTQVIGLRFAGVTVPQGAKIGAAYIQFTSRVQTDMNSMESPPASTSFMIFGEAADNPGPFVTSMANDVSLRVKTTASVAWTNIPLWNAMEQAGPDQRTPALTTVIQEIVNRPFWYTGNAMTFVITGTGTRSAQSFSDQTPEKAAILHIEFTGGNDGGPPEPSGPDGGVVDGGVDAAAPDVSLPDAGVDAPASGPEVGDAPIGN
jgi:hypothetical protein